MIRRSPASVLAKPLFYMENVLMRFSGFFGLLAVFCLLSAPVEAGVVRTVVVDAGHGGYDLGMRVDESREKDIALDMAKKLQRAIEDSGRFAYLDREVDHYMSIEERRSRANELEPDLFLSLHLSGTEDVNIYVAWFEKKDAELSLSEYYAIEARQRRYLHESNVLARAVAAALREAFAVNVYVHEIALPLLESVGAPAIMVEMPSEGIEYDLEDGKLVSAILGGIRRYEQD